MTPSGIANGLRANHGYDLPTSKELARRLLHPHSCCAICGVPTWVLRLHHSRGGPFLLGGARFNFRLAVDHIDPTGPSTLENTRLLCYTCNLRRGAGRLSDEEVLRVVAPMWQFCLPPKRLYWLNTTPGTGGRVNRSERCQRQDVRYVGLLDAPIHTGQSSGPTTC